METGLWWRWESQISRQFACSLNTSFTNYQTKRYHGSCPFAYLILCCCSIIGFSRVILFIETTSFVWQPVLEAKATAVWLDKNYRPVRIPSEVKAKLTQFMRRENLTWLNKIPCLRWMIKSWEPNDLFQSCQRGCCAKSIQKQLKVQNHLFVSIRHLVVLRNSNKSYYFLWNYIKAIFFFFLWKNLN